MNEINFVTLWANYPQSEMERKEKAKRLSLYLLGVTVYYIWFQMFYNMVAFGNLCPYHNVEEVLIGIGYNFFPIFSLFVLNTLIVFQLTKSFTSIWAKGLTDFLCSIGATILVNFVFLGVRKWGFHTGGYVDWAGTLINDFLMLLINEVVYFVMHYRESMLREEKQRYLATRMQYDMLKIQVNPHFLFNSLNILYSLTDIDVEKSREFIMALSQMYRYLLSQQQIQRVKLRDELRFLESYVKVLAMRYRDSFYVHIQGLEKAGEHEVAPYCLQLLIENITKHNAIRAECPMHVTIAIDDQKLTVTNPLYPKINASLEPSTGMGLRYINEICKYHGRQFAAEKRNQEFVAELPFL